MDRQTLHRLLQADFERLLEILSTHQHLHPHEPVSAALAKTVDEIGVCPNAVEASLRWLNLEGATAIGRLRRTELMQLARTVHRFWRHDVTPATPQRQSR